MISREIGNRVRLQRKMYSVVKIEKGLEGKSAVISTIKAYVL